MKRIIVLLLISTSLYATPLEKGVKPGLFTQDYEAALSYAKEMNLPIFLNFTGSDWCGWCKLMVSNVFTKSEWSDFAKENMVLVTLDYPSDKSLVPEEYVERNRTLQDVFGVTGYPTYIVMESDGFTEFGRTGAGRDKTVDSFISEMKNILKFSSNSLNKFSSKLTGTQLKEYQEEFEVYKKLQEQISEWYKTKPEELLELSKNRLLDYQASYAKSKMSPAEIKKYDSAMDRYYKVQDEIDAWFLTGPENSEANRIKYGEFMDRLDSEKAIADSIINKYIN